MEVYSRSVSTGLLCTTTWSVLYGSCSTHGVAQYGSAAAAVTEKIRETHERRKTAVGGGGGFCAKGKPVCDARWGREGRRFVLEPKLQHSVPPANQTASLWKPGEVRPSPPGYGVWSLNAGAILAGPHSTGERRRLFVEMDIRDMPTKMKREGEGYNRHGFGSENGGVDLHTGLLHGVLRRPAEM